MDDGHRMLRKILKSHRTTTQKRAHHHFGHSSSNRWKGNPIMIAGKSHSITLIPGDGIGPEVTRAVLEIINAARHPTAARFEWETCEAGANAHAVSGEHIPKSLLQSIDRNRVALKGPLTTPIGSGFPSINVRLRKEFELFANFAW
jgi:isocitrate dehydrogenase (NAD+)